MAFNINEFINTALPRDGLRPNLFEIQMIGPSGVNPRNFQFKAKATSIPSSVVGITPVMYYGRQVKLAGNRQFENWPVTVIMDEDDYAISGVRGAFTNWSQMVNYHIGNFRNTMYVPPNTGGYFGTGIIYHKYKDNTGDTNVYMMQGCWPVEVGPITLDWADNDRVAEFQVTFAYQWWNDQVAVA
jgi:hypothetical protein